MKTALSILGILFGIFILLQLYISMSIFKTEQQKYSVISTDGDMEIRFYPSATLATIRMDVKSYKELSSPGFRKLAGYIFGGNTAAKQIPMTAPVHMDIQDTGSSMSFVMPDQYDTGNLPEPKDSTIILEKTKDEYVAAIRFGGYASDQKIRENTEKLVKILKEKAIAHQGNFRFLGYNPPYQLLGRRNEVIVSIEWNKNK